MCVQKVTQYYFLHNLFEVLQRKNIHLQSAFYYRRVFYFLWIYIPVLSVFFSHLSLSDSKSPQIFKPLLNILANLNSFGVWVVSNLQFSQSLFQAFGDRSNFCIHIFFLSDTYTLTHYKCYIYTVNHMEKKTDLFAFVSMKFFYLLKWIEP